MAIPYSSPTPPTIGNLKNVNIDISTLANEDVIKFNELTNLWENGPDNASGGVATKIEITDTNKNFLAQGRLKVEQMGRGYAWLDTGTLDSLLEASMFVQTLEKRQGMKISCIEEIAYRMGYINKNQLISLGELMQNNPYGQYLIKIAKRP